MRSTFAVDCTKGMGWDGFGVTGGSSAAEMGKQEQEQEKEKQD